MPDPRPPVSLERLARNLAAVRETIGEAAARASRPLESIRLVAVTKYASIEETAALKDLGVTDFGESRIQEAERKVAALSKPGDVYPRWHLIGHLQTNKADKAVMLFHTIHSVDSDRVAIALGKEAKKRRAPEAPPLPCLIEVNVAGEENKYGLKPDLAEIGAVLDACAELPSIRIAGLMAMAPYADSPEGTSRPVFRRLKELFDQLNAAGRYRYPLTELSMGMTQDYAIAIEEGATIIRVGSALFEND